LSNTAEVHNENSAFRGGARRLSERYRQTAEHVPASTSQLLSKVPPESAHVRGIITIASRDHPELTILTGDFASRIPSHHERWRAASLEPGFLFIGEIEIVNAAFVAWRDTSRKPPAWASRIREVSAAYGNWLVALDPIPDSRHGIAPAPLPYWDAWSSIRSDASMFRRRARPLDPRSPAKRQRFRRIRRSRREHRKPPPGHNRRTDIQSERRYDPEAGAALAPPTPRTHRPIQRQPAPHRPSRRLPTRLQPRVGVTLCGTTLCVSLSGWIGSRLGGSTKFRGHRDWRRISRCNS